MVSLLAKQVVFDSAKNVIQRAPLVVCVLDGRGWWKTWWDTNKRNHLCHCYVEEGVITRWSQPSLPTVFRHNRSYSQRLPSTVTALPFSCFRLHSHYSSCLALFLPCTSLSLNPTHFTKCASRKVYSMLLPINCLKLFRLDRITVIHFFNVIFRSFVANSSLYNMS